MGVSKSMKIFTEAMQNSMSTSGYGSKIVNTAMGPFKWDDNIQMWVNVNNGFKMSNISMNDQYMFDYDSVLGTSPQKSTQSQICTEIFAPRSSGLVTIKNIAASYTRISLTGTFSQSISCPLGIPIALANFNNYPNNPATLNDAPLDYLVFEYSTNGGSTWTEFVPNYSDHTSSTAYVLNGQQVGTDVLFAVSTAVNTPQTFPEPQVAPALWVFQLINVYDSSIIRSVTISISNN